MAVVQMCTEQAMRVVVATFDDALKFVIRNVINRGATDLSLGYRDLDSLRCWAICSLLAANDHGSLLSVTMCATERYGSM